MKAVKYSTYVDGEAIKVKKGSQGKIDIRSQKPVFSSLPSSIMKKANETSSNKVIQSNK